MNRPRISIILSLSLSSKLVEGVETSTVEDVGGGGAPQVRRGAASNATAARGRGLEAVQSVSTGIATTAVAARTARTRRAAPAAPEHDVALGVLCVGVVVVVGN